PSKVKEVNETLLTLIPKTPRPSDPSQFRPISLCNVAYKEVVHSMEARKGKIGQMILKIDLAKAYDRIRWSFVKRVLEASNFPPDLIELIMACITSTSFQILWNGGCSEAFSPERGLRQGCPLSPYLFTLCIEYLSCMIINRVEDGSWQPIRVARDSEALSHIFFADDLILFSTATVRQAQLISDCLEAFGEISGESVSREKSRVFFSKNVNQNLASSICSTLGMSATRNLGRYLGILVLHGRTTVDKFEYIIERIDHKLSGWKCSSLSLAGRVTLAVSVLNALPAYAMQTCFIPFTICDKIDAKIRSFVWGSQQGSRKTHLVSWEHICRPKDQGGLGLRSAREMNQAFILKVAWGLLKRPGELWARVLLSKYLSQSPNGLVPRTTKRFSNLWKGIRLYWDTLSQGLQWSIRSGKQTSFWKERWLDSGIILENHVLDDHSPNRSAVVADFVSQSGEWDVA
ncbi:Putative ribonuclease H protein At1g65750, partial [Linum perenne]